MSISAAPAVADDRIVLGCGTVVVDYLATVAAFPKPDDKIRSTSLKVEGGGNAGNALTGAARLGLKPRLISKSNCFSGKFMVSTQGEMEARLEVLEREFEGLLSMRENVEKMMEESRQQITYLTALVRRTMHRNQGDQQDEEVHTNNDDTSVNHGRNRPKEERWRKLEILVFDGTDAYGWLNKVDRYFDLKRMNEGEKL